MLGCGRLRLALLTEFSELFFLVLLHSLLFEIGFIFLGEFRLADNYVAVYLCAFLNLVLVKGYSDVSAASSRGVEATGV